MERWKARARRWEFRAAQRRLERRRKTGESTPGTISDDEALPLHVRRRADLHRRPRRLETLGVAPNRS